MANSPTTQSGPPDPQTLDALSQLVMRLPRAGPPIDPLNAGTPSPMRVPGNDPNDPNATVTAKPVAAPPQPAPPAAPVTQPPPNAPSDDPAITNARSAAQTATDALQKQLGAYQTAQKGFQAVPQVNPANYKPKWYDRLLGAGVGFAEGYGKGNEARGAEAGGQATYRALTAAQLARQRAVAPFLSQMQSSRDEIPILSAAQEAAQREFTNALGQRKENETERRNQAQEALDKSKNDAVALYQQGKIDEGNKRLEEQAQGLQDRLRLGEASLQERQQIADMTNLFRQQSLEQSMQLKQQGTDRASLEKERAARLKDVEDRWTHNPYMSRLASTLGGAPTKEQEISSINSDINNRLASVGPNAGGASATTGNATPKTTSQRTPAATAPNAPPAASPLPAGVPTGATHIGKDAKGNVTGYALNGQYHAMTPGASASPAKGSSAPIAPPASAWKDKTKGLRVRQGDGSIGVWKLDNGTPVLVSSENK